jgi:AraC-like DNA-binding protein
MWPQSSRPTAMPRSRKDQAGHQPRVAAREPAPAHFHLERNRRRFGFPFFLVVQLRGGLRMRHACELLRNQNPTIKETAALLGYEDPFHFSRILKLVTGVAPCDYRNMILDSPREKSDSAQTNSGKETARYLPLSQFVSSKAFKHRAPRRTSRPVAV